MSDWESLAAVFWALWAVDGWRLAPVAGFNVVAGWGGGRAGMSFGRIAWPARWPRGWRTQVSDVPLAMAAEGICNRPVGSAGRPVEVPSVVTAWRWEEIAEVRAAAGWLWVNGQRFCRNTGQVAAAQLLELARLPAAGREESIRGLIRGWFRPARLRRKVRLLEGRTAVVAACNVGLLVVAWVLTAQLATPLVAVLPAAGAAAFGRALPWLALLGLGLHLGGVISAWRAQRRLKPPVPANLFSALLLPPQAIRLRGLLGAAWLPAQHPVAYALAFAGGRERDLVLFQALADVLWPVPADGDSPLARTVAEQMRRMLHGEIVRAVTVAGLVPEDLLAAPAADGPDSCRYCPRCRDQFTTPAGRCPHGVALLPLARPTGGGR